MSLGIADTNVSILVSRIWDKDQSLMFIQFPLRPVYFPRYQSIHIAPIHDSYLELRLDHPTILGWHLHSPAV
jgi:hypothetical protein